MKNNAIQKVEIAIFPINAPEDHYWMDAWNQWFNFKKSESTQTSYLRAWYDLLGFTQKHPRDIYKKDIVAWIESMNERNFAAQTINQRIMAVSSFYNYVCHEYEIELPNGTPRLLHNYNPAGARNIRPHIEWYGKAISLTLAEVKALFDAIPRNTPKGLRDYALFLTYIATGRRNSEVRHLKYGDIYLQDGDNGQEVWYRWSGKLSEDQLYQMPSDVWNAIKDYLVSAGRWDVIEKDDYLFISIIDNDPKVPLCSKSISRLLKEYCAVAGLDIEAVHVHTLRHTATKLRMMEGYSLRDLQSFLHHQHYRVTEIYAGKIKGHKDNDWDSIMSRIEAHDE